MRWSRVGSKVVKVGVTGLEPPAELPEPPEWQAAQKRASKRKKEDLGMGELWAKKK